MTAKPEAVDWTALIRAGARALADLQANRPMAAPPPMSSADIANALKAIQADLPWLIEKLKTYPGVIRGVDDILVALEAEAPWAAEVKAALDQLPGGLAALESWLPTVLGLLTAFAPAPGKFIGIA